MPELERRSVGYIQSAAKTGQPFFLYLPLTAPHTPIAPSGAFRGSSGLNAYADFVREVDHLVGAILDALQQSGLHENTLVVFTADNGCSPEANFAFLASRGHKPSGPFRGFKADLYEGGHRVPLLLQWPKKIPSSKTVGQTVCLNDFMATFATITGYKLGHDEAEDSYNILPLLHKPEQQQPIREATVHHSYYGAFAIRKGKWKLLLAPGSGGWSFPTKQEDLKGLPPVQLYDMEADPGEITNLQDKHPEVVQELEALLRQYQASGRSVTR
jgi:arylsulfatase A-like enzyme